MNRTKVFGKRILIATIAATFVAQPAFGGSSGAAAGATGSDLKGNNLKIEIDVTPGEINVRDTELSLEAGGTMDREGKNGATVEGTARKLWYIGGDAEGTEQEGFFIDPGVRLRLDIDKDGVRRQDIDATGFGLYRLHLIDTGGLVPLPKEERERAMAEYAKVKKEHEVSSEEANRAYWANDKAAQKLWSEVRNTSLSQEERNEAHRKVTQGDYPEQKAWDQALKRREAAEAKLEELLETYSYPDGSAGKVAAQGTFDVNAVKASFIHRKNDSLDYESNAALIEVVKFGGHVSRRLNGQNFDFCGELSPMGLEVGEMRAGDQSSKVGYRLRGSACMGISLGNVGRLKAEGEYELFASGLADTETKETKEGIETEAVHDAYVAHTVRGSIGLDRIGGSPVGVNVFAEREMLSGAPDQPDRNHTIYGIGVKAAY